MKKLGFGLMRMPLIDPNDDGAVDVEQVKKMVDLFMEKGFTYFDTAIMYNGCQSQRVAKEALVDRYPRDSFTLATKLHNAFFHSLEDRDKVFFEQLEQTGAGYFDYYLLHGIEAGSYPKYEQLDCFNWLLEKKAQGLVKHAGFSFHDTPELLDEILTKHPEMEFVQLQINYLDWESEWIQSRKVYEVAEVHGKPVIVMEPVKGGTLVNLPQPCLDEIAARGLSPAELALRFAAGFEGMAMVLSGMSNPAQMADNLRAMTEPKPLDEAELALIDQIRAAFHDMRLIPCTGCSYCTEGCPMQIPIPKYFSLYNEDMREDLAEKGWTINFSYYDNLTERFGKAKDCIACGQCEGVCPQHLPIIEKLKAVSAHFDH